MSRLYGGDDTLHACQFVAAVDGLVVVDAQHLCTTFLCHVTVHGANTRIVQSGRDGKGFLNLSVLVLHHQHLGTMQDACCALVDGGCCVVGLPTMSACFCQNDSSFT